MNIKNSLTGALPLIAGGIAANLVKSLSGKVIQNEKLRAAAPLVIGIILSSMKGKFSSIGNGMIAVGGATLIGTFVPSLAGIEDIDLSGIGYDVLNDDVSGTEDIQGMDDTINDDVINDTFDY